jgi:hypothetical protein
MTIDLAVEGGGLNESTCLCIMKSVEVANNPG